MSWSFVGKGGFAGTTSLDKLAAPITSGVASGDWRVVPLTFKGSSDVDTKFYNEPFPAATYYDPIVDPPPQYNWNSPSAGYLTQGVYCRDDSDTTGTIRGYIPTFTTMDVWFIEEFTFRESGAGADIQVRVTDSGTSAAQQQITPSSVTVGPNSIILSVVAISDNETLSLTTANGFTIAGQQATSLGSDLAYAVAYRDVSSGGAGTYDLPTWNQVSPVSVDSWVWNSIVIGDVSNVTGSGSPTEATDTSAGSGTFTSGAGGGGNRMGGTGAIRKPPRR